MTPLPEAVATFLAEHHVMTLATHGDDGPWAAAVFYAHDGGAFDFLSSPETRHARHLARDPRCAATIQPDVAEWARIRGVQLEGRVRELSGDDARLAHERYGRKFPLVADLASAPRAIALAFAKVRWYRLEADRLRFIDNRRGFGHRETVELRPRA